MNDGTFPILKTIGWIFGIGVILILLVAAWFVFGSQIQRSVINPQVRQNIVQDPQTRIDNRKDFHSKLGEVISADQDILSGLYQVQKCGNSQTSACDTYTRELMGLQAIRSTSISGYNAETDNPDVNHDLETWMPTHIDAGIVSGDPSQETSFITSEMTNLQKYYNRGTQEGE